MEKLKRQPYINLIRHARCVILFFCKNASFVFFFYKGKVWFRVFKFPLIKPRQPLNFLFLSQILLIISLINCMYIFLHSFHLINCHLFFLSSLIVKCFVSLYFTYFTYLFLFYFILSIWFIKFQVDINSLLLWIYQISLFLLRWSGEHQIYTHLVRSFYFFLHIICFITKVVNAFVFLFHIFSFWFFVFLLLCL